MGAADSYFQKADLALKKHNYEYAIELFLQGLSIDPKITARRRQLHQIETLAIQEKGGNPAGGMATKLKVMGNEAQVKKLHFQKKYDEEVIEIEKILRHQPQNVGALNALAQALELMEVHDGAIATYEEIIALNKTDVEAFRRMGKLLDKIGDVDKAIECWEKVKLYKPEDKEAGKAIRDLSAAKMVKQQDDRKKAGGDESFRALLKDQSESEELQKKQMIIRTDEDRKRAIRFKVEEIKKDSQNSRLWRELGALFQDLKEWAKAEESFRKAMEVNPQDLYAVEKLGTLKETRLDLELEELRKKIEASGNGNVDPSLLDLLPKKEEEVRKFKLTEYDRRCAAHPTDYELKVKLGKVLRESRKFDEAIGQFQKAVKDPKLKVVSHTQIGHCFVEKELYDLAIGQFSSALSGVADIDSEVGKDIKYSLADANERKGDHNPADASRRKADYLTAIDLFQQIMSIDIAYRDVSGRVDKLREKVAGVGVA